MIKLIVFSAFIIAFLFSVFLLTVKTSNRQANRILVGFIFICALDLSGYFMADFPLYLTFKNPLTLLIFPLFYLFALSITRNDFKLKKLHLLHLIPFSLYLIINIIIYMYSGYLENTGLFQKIQWLFLAIILKLQASIYIVSVVILLKKHRRIFIENYSDGSFSAYRFLSHIVIIFLLILPLTVAKELLVYHSVFDSINNILVITAMFMFCWFLFQALYYPELFRGIDSSLQPLDKLYPLVKNELPQEVSVAGNQEITARIELIRNYMQEKEPYLEPDFNLPEMSQQLNISLHELSFIINRHIGCHFFDFVNEYRINKAVSMLENSKENGLTIQQIYYSAGFNSKSSFNTAFKKYTGTTPTGYKNRIK